MEDATKVLRVIQTGLQKRWPNADKDDCECAEDNWPFLIWGISDEGRLITICVHCRCSEWGQEYEESE